MGESAELTQIQHDQSHIVSFPNLDKRETAPAASHWHRVGAKAKQHTKVNQQAHSTPLKLTLPLKNRFLPLQESTNATHAPLSPEMRPDGQCGQRRKNQSPRRRAVHVSATVQQGPISEKADEPDTLIIGDSTIKDITATIRAQAEKKRDYSLPHTSTLPLSDTQIADSPQTLNSPPDAIDTTDSPQTLNSPPDAIDTTDSPQTLNSPPDAINTVVRGTARNGHPSTPPPPYRPPPPWSPPMSH
ncbi:unnamed protein product [Boreogadus saida]